MGLLISGLGHIFKKGNKGCVLTINGFVSGVKTIQHGLPQGSVLGPILFLLYINDLNKCSRYSDTFHFADDTDLLNISNDYNTLQNNVNCDLCLLHEWLLANKITVNKDKTELIYFHKARLKVPTNLNIKMNGKKLYHSNKMKYLGVYVDETLSDNEHCKELTKKPRLC